MKARLIGIVVTAAILAGTYTDHMHYSYSFARPDFRRDSPGAAGKKL